MKKNKRIKVFVVGCNGHMGQIVCRLISESTDLELAGGFDKVARELPDSPAFEDLCELQSYVNEFPEFIDVIVDFSQPECTMKILSNIAYPYHVPMVIATTGFSEEQLANIEEISKNVPIFMSSNMSYEISLLEDILKMIAPKLAADHDIEIVETHHNRKKDAPSGTAKTLANAINESLGNSKKIVYGRDGKREIDEIGIASLRGGNVVGEHTIKFLGTSDELTITHKAYSRELFAEGALKAIRFISGVEKPELYGMKDL